MLDWLRKTVLRIVYNPEVLISLIHDKWKPYSSGEIRGSKIKSILKELGTKNIFISDSKYKKISKNVVKEFLSNDMTDLRKYVPEKYDCDNYSFSLMGKASYLLSGYAIGIVWADTPNGKHALNFYIDKYEAFWFIEPQTDEIFYDGSIKPFLAII